MTKKINAASKFGHMTDEEFVRANWEWTHYLPNTASVVISDGNGTTDPTTRFDGPECEAWAPAAEFTRSRLEEVRQIEEEIRILSDDTVRMRGLVVSQEHRFIVEYIRWMRALARLESIRAELQRGMKS